MVERMNNSFPHGVPGRTLSDGTVIPQLGFGVWQVDDDEAERACAHALKVGYRHIDSASAYRNEAGVGRAVAGSELDRADVFVTTKLWNGDHGYDKALRAFDISLGKLGMDYVDLYLIHWPTPARDLYSETWRALIELHKQGRARAIGVSNFHQTHLERIIADSGVTPVINQIELHPYLQQVDMRMVNSAKGIITEAWSPLGSGHGLLEDPVLAEIADRVGATPAQVVLAWHLAIGNVVIPKSVTPSRIEENLAATGVTLSSGDIAAIATLDRGTRTGPDPDTANFH